MRKKASDIEEPIPLPSRAAICGLRNEMSINPSFPLPIGNLEEK
jgi:hypothetical protein